MLTQNNLVSNFLAVSGLFPIGPEDTTLSFLPLSHVFQRIVDYLFFYKGLTIQYLTSIEQAPKGLMEVKPTVMASVPRLYERAYLRVIDNVRKEPQRKQDIFNWAVELGEKCCTTGELDVPLRYKLQYAAATGWSSRRSRTASAAGCASRSRAAPRCRQKVGRFFTAVGIDLYEGYGLTETSPVLCVNRPGAARFGTVGRTIPGVELWIADDGEILAKSPGLMRGYWNQPEATAIAIDPEGWFHTGDIGDFDADGFLRITDRKKDLIVTSGGKNIAPQPIEQLLTASGVLAQAIVIGDNYPYLTALVVPASEELPEELQSLTPAERMNHPLMLGAGRSRGRRSQPQARRARARPPLPVDGPRVHRRQGRDDADAQAQAPGDPRALRRAGVVDVSQVAAARRLTHRGRAAAAATQRTALKTQRTALKTQRTALKDALDCVPVNRGRRGSSRSHGPGSAGRSGRSRPWSERRRGSRTANAG